MYDHTLHMGKLLLSLITIFDKMETIARADNVHSGPKHDDGEIASLSPFWLATYMMQGDL